MTDNLPATPQDDLDFTGLEDFDLEDAVIPRLKIMHKTAEFKDNLSGATFKKINLIILAMNKQRILWHPQVDDNDKPMCRSADFNLGFPISAAEATKGKEFPWDRSGFGQADMQPDANGDVILECERCKLKEWGSHPLGKIPYCAEQWTLSVLYDGINDDGTSSGMYSIALLTLQKSGLKAIKAYLTSFQRAKQPAFTAVCEVGLNLQGRGDVVFSTPSFRNVGKTDQSEWSSYGQQAKQMRNFLKRAPEPLDTEGEGSITTSDNSYNPPPSATQVSTQTGTDPWAAAAAQTAAQTAADQAAAAAANQVANQQPAAQAVPAQPATPPAAPATPPPAEPVATPAPNQPASGLPF